MDIMALLGILLIVYSVLVFYVSLKKPKAIWEMKKIKLFIKMLGEKGTVILFMIIALAAFGGGFWLMLK